jgi:tetratricopeptide (TPR) repeat protein
MQARLALASGANDEALALAGRALTSARAERSGDSIADRYRVAAAYRLLGDLSHGMGRSEAAKNAWASGLAQLPQNVTERPWEMKERAELLRRRARTEEARPLMQKLAAIEYRSPL